MADGNQYDHLFKVTTRLVVFPPPSPISLSPALYFEMPLLKRIILGSSGWRLGRWQVVSLSPFVNFAFQTTTKVFSLSSHTHLCDGAETACIQSQGV